MELKKIAKRNERREKRVSNDKKRPKVRIFLTLLPLGALAHKLFWPIKPLVQLG